MNDQKSSDSKVSRRGFGKTASAAAAASAFGFQFVPSHVWGANERPALGGIGIGGKGASDIGNSSDVGFQVVGLVDVVDTKKMPESKGRFGGQHNTREKFPDAKFYTDYKEMLADLGDKVDAVTISTPDHHHAFAAIAAMKAGKHVYCQKPLTHGIGEARALTRVATETGVKTQMGNQAHAQDHMRRVVELIRAGIIGKVKEIHSWTNRPIWPQGFQNAPAAEEVPDYFDWKQWVGPAPHVDYSSKIAPFAWRGWWHYGTGALGDMACHIMDGPYWACGLGAPTALQAEEEGGSELSAPINSHITYEFAENEFTAKGGLKYHWYDGQIGAKFDEENWKLIPGEFNRPDKVLNGLDHTEGRGYGSAIIGERGELFFNRSKNNWIVRPTSALDGFTGWPEESVPRARNQDPHAEFFDAVTGKIEHAESDFAHAGPFTETILLGCVAQKNPGVKLQWDVEKLAFTGKPELAKQVQRDYAAGWELGA